MALIVLHNVSLIFPVQQCSEGELAGVPWAVEMPVHNRAINPLIFTSGSQIEDEQDQAGLRFQLNHRILY